MGLVLLVSWLMENVDDLLRLVLNPYGLVLYLLTAQQDGNCNLSSSECNWNSGLAGLPVKGEDI